MQVKEYQLNQEAPQALRDEAQKTLEGVSSLNELIDQWTISQGHKFGLRLALQDDGKISDDTLEIFFATADGVGLGSGYVPVREVIQGYQTNELLESLIMKQSGESHRFDLDDRRYDKRLARLGFTNNDILAGKIGAREGTIPALLFFALSKGGCVEVVAVDSGEPFFEEIEEELDEAGIGLADYFHLLPSYTPEPESQSPSTLHFDAIYCRKK